MFGKVWKSLALLGVSVLLVPSHASACTWAGAFESVFYESEPDTVDHDHDFFGARFLPKDIATESFTGQIVIHLDSTETTPYGASQKLFLAEIVESSTHPERVGSKLGVFPVAETSCGPWLEDGESGLVIGDILNAESSSPELFLHQYRLSETF